MKLGEEIYLQCSLSVSWLLFYELKQAYFVLFTLDPDSLDSRMFDEVKTPFWQNLGENYSPFCLKIWYI